MGGPPSGHLPASRGQHRLQGRQRPRFPRALGRRARLDGDARCRQPNDRRRHPASGRHHADRSEARHPAEPRDRHALDERLCANLPVRHAPRPALLDRGQRLVAGRLRTILGPQRSDSRGAVQASLRDPAAGRPRPAQPRPDRGGADAARRVRRTRAAGGGSGLGGEPADPDRIPRARPALVPGDIAISVLHRPARPALREPRPAPLRHADVLRFACLDRPAARRHSGPGDGAHSDRGGRRTLWRAAAHAHPVDVVRAQDRDDDRRSYPAGAASRLRRRRAVLGERRRGNRVLSVAFADHVGVPHVGTGRRAIQSRSRLERAGAREPRHRVVGRAAQVVASDGAWGCYSCDPRHSAAGGLTLCVRAAGRRPCSCGAALCRHLVAMARHGNGSPGYRPPARGDRSAGAATGARAAGSGDALRLLRGLRAARGVLRSLRIYYGHPARASAMDALYAQFVRPDDLVFDVGAHVGDRIAVFRRLGARVVAVEPQPALYRTLKLLFGRDAAVTLVPSAIGQTPGNAAMRINTDNPTISTLSPAFIAAARDAVGWEGETWSESVEVAVTTLDALIDAHGVPSFLKLDVEGFELEALAGLSGEVAALSFEFTTIQRDVALDCLERCGALGYTDYNAALGESQALGAWRSAAAMADWLSSLPHAANSGDIYARRA